MPQRNDKKGSNAILEGLNRQLQSELEAVNRYLHHSFMVFGFSRKPIVSYFREQATESLGHAVLLGEKIVALGGHPQVDVKARWEPEQHAVKEMLEINLRAEQEALAGYHSLLGAVSPGDVALEEMLRSFIRQETEHVEELQKYLRTA
jgi:bacterioferritin